MRHPPPTDIEAVPEVGVFDQRPLPAAISDRQYKRQGRVVERDRRGAGDRSGHIGHTVVNYPLRDIGRYRMCGRPARLKTASLIYRDIDYHCARVHRSDEFAAYE